MPYPQTLGAAPTLPAGEDPVLAANDQNFTLAVQYGVEPDTVAGYDDYYNARASFPTGGRKAVTLAHPELAALIASGMAAGAYGGDDLNTLLALMLNTTTNVVDQVQGVWADLPPDILQRYATAVRLFLPIFMGLPAPNVSLSDPVEQWREAYQAALQSGPVVTIPDQQGGSVQIPLAFVIEGPVILPDGMAYVIVNEADGPGVTWWRTAAFVPLQYQSVFVRPDSCEPVVPGTGEWYVRAAATGDTGPCSGVPVGWTDGFSLVSAQALRSVSFGPVQPLILADGTTVAPTGTPAPANVVTQDADGNVIAGEQVTPTAPAPVPVAEVSLLPVATEPNVSPGSNLGPGATPVGAASVSPIVLAGLGLGALWLLSSKGRR